VRYLNRLLARLPPLLSEESKTEAIDGRRATSD
jgi:hypothetical protein